ncbi:ABC transporter substrate-binding protein [Brevibacillus brevis]|uniref:ABC transporter substrate-binding protein n=1 Tax=Brevibacillus brevis TaxID=1393 RepID=UPI0025A52E49|nr:ABC transporter substrate-binding protein [Brevibacillus brevis]WJQ84418.1 ABC transporter substrate-binding protein [Brevibacillus brevis]
MGIRKREIATFVSIVLSCFVLLAIVSGCDAPATKSGTDDGNKDVNISEKKGGTITVAISSEPDTLDAHKSTALSTEGVALNLGGALLYRDPQTNEVKPYLAESYSISEDGKTWTFRIRQGVTFHDGTPLTAQAYKRTFERAMSPEIAPKGVGMVLGIIQSIKTPDDQTLILELNEPSATLLTYFTSASWMQPLSVYAVQKFGDQYGRNPVGVGPWKMESWKSGDSIMLVQNDAYRWAPPSFQNQGPVRPDKLVLKLIRNPQTAVAALESGTIDIADLPAKDAKKFKNNNRFTVLEQTKRGLGLFVELNLNNEILQDKNVRKALQMAVKKEAIVQSHLQGEGIVADGPLPANLFGYDPSIAHYAYKYNPEEAVKLLEEAGWKLNAQGIREKAGKPLHLELLSMELWSQPAQLMQGMFKAIGVDVKIITLEGSAVDQLTAAGTFDLALDGYVADDPDILFPFMHSSQIGGMNRSAIHDKTIDSLLEKGQVTMKSDDRAKIYEELQKRSVEEAFWIPIYTEKRFVVVNNRVQGLMLDPSGLKLYQDVWVK